ncbi:MAG: GNAT family N-acetyltransferase, partial [Pseudomonadota bacterium]
MNYAQEQVSIIGQFSLASAWQNFCQLPRFLNFRPRYSFRLETDQYILTTANGIPQIYGALCLRYQCFIYQNHLLGRFMGLDIDEFDYGCDHIIVIDKKSKWIIGTYRARASSFCQSYYSQGEFELSHFLATGGIKLELGRACILENHRNGAVIDLLWKGIGRYANLCNAQYIFG